MMSLFSKSFKAFLMVVATALLPMLASCQLITEDYDDEISDNSASRYINITVSVSASNEPVTRANPTGGETGDGLEKGLERENAVDNITLIFYEDNAGINTPPDANTKVAFFATYPVTKTDNNPFGHNHNLDDPNVGWTGDVNHQESTVNEVIYSTGNQKLEDNTLEVTKTYHAIVVANAPQNLLSQITKETTIAQVRDMVVSTVYNVGTGKATDAKKFVMSSERDATVTFTNKWTDEKSNSITYYFDCIHIERLAARIDFWAKTKDPEQTASYMAATYDGTTYDHAGYVYNVGQKDANNKQDHFVLTSITPFNLMNGNEYLLKRTNDTNGYLAKETTSNWVLDPYTDTKTTTDTHPSYLISTLTTVSTDMANDYNVELSNCQTASTETTEGTKFSVTENNVTADNIILNYPRENTLKGGETPLYYYATGLAFEGYYYKKGTTTGGTRKVFYHYLRHQGEQDAAYQAWTKEQLEKNKSTLLCPASTAMNFGIVRNNIYRVNIESISSDNDNLFVRILIKVKKWDKFVHTPIYM